MNGDAVKEIKALAIEASEEIEVDGITYSPRNLRAIIRDPRPEPIKIRTLSGFVDYVNRNVDEQRLAAEYLVHVKGYDEIELISKYDGPNAQRTVLVRVSLDERETFPFGKFIPPDEFNVRLRSQFEDSEDLKKVIRYTGKIDVENAISVTDDGITQVASLKQGVSGARKENETLEPIVYLKPYRSFSEIEQPSSAFLFRMKGGGDEAVRCALFEADGGAWKITARMLVKELLVAELPEMTIIA